MTRVFVPIAVASGVLLVACVSTAHGGLFGFGDSNRAADAKKATATEVYDPNRIATGPKIAPTNKKASSGGGWFGLGKEPSPPPKASLATLAAQSKKPDKNEKASWWDSLFKPKEPSPPKHTSEWMKLKPVRW